MKKQLTAALLLFCLLCGCNNTKAPEEPLPSPALYNIGTSTVNTVLYYKNDKNDVLASTVNLTHDSNESLYSSIMSRLLKSDSSQLLSAFDEGVECRSITLIEKIMFIDLSWRFLQMKESDIFVALNVLISTFTLFDTVDFVNVTVEGKQLCFNKMPARPYLLFSAYSGTADEMLTRYNSRCLQYATDPSTMYSVDYAVIFSPDSSGLFLFPEPISLSVTGCDYKTALLSALIAGGANKKIFDKDFLLYEQPIYIEEQKTLNISFTAPRGWEIPENWLAPQALYNTLACVYPGMEFLTLTVYGDDALNIVYRSSSSVADYPSCVRSRTSVFVPDGTRTKLVKKTFLLTQSPNGASLKDLACAVLNESFNTQNSAEQMVCGVATQNDIVIIDLDSSAFSALSDLSDQQEYSVVYSITATMCRYAFVHRALIIENGRSRQYFNNSIYIAEPLLTLPQTQLDALKNESDNQ